MKRVYDARDVTEAHLVRGLLESSGIPAQVHGEALAGAEGEVPFAWPSVWVTNDSDYEAARRLIEERPGPASPTHCPGCGYDLTGLPEPRCPECGRPFLRVPSWVCPACGEMLEGQFTECWKCGAARDDTA